MQIHSISKFLKIIFLFIFFSCDSTPLKEERNSTVPESSLPEPVIEIKTFKESLGWGYDIFVNDQKYIHQPHIPAIAGNRGFTSEVSAHKTAEFIAYKIRKNIMPPSVTAKELDSLGVLE